MYIYIYVIYAVDIIYHRWHGGYRDLKLLAANWCKTEGFESVAAWYFQLLAYLYLTDRQSDWNEPVSGTWDFQGWRPHNRDVSFCVFFAQSVFLGKIYWIDGTSKNISPKIHETFDFLNEHGHFSWKALLTPPVKVVVSHARLHRPWVLHLLELKDDERPWYFSLWFCQGDPKLDIATTSKQEKTG